MRHVKEAWATDWIHTNRNARMSLDRLLLGCQISCLGLIKSRGVHTSVCRYLVKTLHIFILSVMYNQTMQGMIVVKCRPLIMKTWRLYAVKPDSAMTYYGGLHSQKDMLKKKKKEKEQLHPTSNLSIFTLMDNKWRHLFKILTRHKVGQPVHSASHISTHSLPLLDCLVCLYTDNIRDALSVFKTPTVGALAWFCIMNKENLHFISTLSSKLCIPEMHSQW